MSLKRSLKRRGQKTKKSAKAYTVRKVAPQSIMLPEGFPEAADVRADPTEIAAEFSSYIQTNDPLVLSPRALFLDFRVISGKKQREFIKLRCQMEGYEAVFLDSAYEDVWVFYALKCPDGIIYTWPETGQARRLQEEILFGKAEVPMLPPKETL